MSESELDWEGGSVNSFSGRYIQQFITNANSGDMQLISVNMLAYRSQYGSVNPSAVVGPGILATIVSTLAAVIFCKLMGRWRRE